MVVGVWQSQLQAYNFFNCEFNKLLIEFTAWLLVLGPSVVTTQSGLIQQTPAFAFWKSYALSKNTASQLRQELSAHTAVECLMFIVVICCFVPVYTRVWLQLVSWDTRQCKVLLEYTEHVNDFSAVATVGVDRNGHFLYAGLFVFCLSRYNTFCNHFLPVFSFQFCTPCDWLSKA